MTITPIGRNTPFVRDSVQTESALGGGPLRNTFTSLIELGQLVVQPCTSTLDVVRIAVACPFVGQQVDQLYDCVGEFLDVGADLGRSVAGQVGQSVRLGGRHVQIAGIERCGQLG